jgi:DNA primase
MQSIRSLLDELGIQYRMSGDEAVALCPSHDDMHPSWSCNTKSGVHHCFSCGFSGNLASLASYILKIPYPEAVIWVTVRAGEVRVNKWREDTKVSNYAPPAYQVSEADMSLFTDPPSRMLKVRNCTQQAAREMGVRWNNQERAYIFPVRDPKTGELWGWQEKRMRRFRNYPHGIRKSETLFGLAAFEHGSPAVLVESPISAVRLRTAGITTGLAAYGVQVSDIQLSLVRDVTEHLVLALDNDSPGMAEVRRICTKFAGFFTTLKVFNYGDYEGKDQDYMTDDQIRFGIDTARSSHFYRNTPPVPARGSRQVRRQV